jgi:amino acid transporter
LFLVLLIIGIKESAVLNNVFTFVNLTVITLVIVVGLTKINGHNWKISPDEVRNCLADEESIEVFF